MKMILIFCFLGIAVKLHSQVEYRPAPPPPGKITRLEYFIDNDPGLGLATNVPVISSENLTAQQFEVSLNGINKGIHFLMVRSQDEEGKWSIPVAYMFDNFPVRPYASSPSKLRITGAEYFIDADPGIGNGIPISIVPDTAVQASTLVSLNGLTPGVHQIFVRTKDESGVWSLTNIRMFDNTSIIPYRESPAAPASIRELEYFIDTDPGFGLGRKIVVPVSENIASLNVDVDITGLNDGMHVIYFRSLEDQWSLSAYVTLQVGSVLPVNFLYVKASAMNDGSLIQWATSEEFNSKKFIVQYSMDGSNYMDAGEVLSSDLPGGSTYSFHHLTANEGLYYYRIRQVDQDGRHTYSRVVQLFLGRAKQEFKVYPNPANNVVFISFTGAREISQVDLLDQQGKILKVLRGGALNKQPVAIEINDFPKGAYYIKIYSKGASVIYPVLKN